MQSFLWHIVLISVPLLLLVIFSHSHCLFLFYFFGVVFLDDRQSRTIYSSKTTSNAFFFNVLQWKRRWCVVRRLSPVANSLIMQLYKKSLNKGKGSQSKASLNLEHLLGFESCFLLQKESQTLAIVCRNLVSVFAFENREMLLEWQAQIAEILGHSMFSQFLNPSS